MPLTQVSGGGLADNSVNAAKIATGAVTAADLENNVALNGNPTTTTQTAGNNSTRIATTAFVTTAVGNKDSITNGTSNVTVTSNAQTTITANNVEAAEFGTAEVVFNDTGADRDFRVESDDNANMLFVDGGEDRVGIGTSSPGAPLDVFASTGTYFKGGSDHVDRQLLISSSTTTNAGDTHTFRAPSSTGEIAFTTDSTERMRIHSSGQVGMGTNGTGTGGSSVDVTVRMTPATSGYGLYASNFSSGTTATPGGYGVYGHMGGTPPSGSAHYGLYGKVDTHSSRSSGGLLAYSINNSIYSILGYWSTAAYYGMYSNGSVYASGGFSSSDSRLKDIVSDGIGTGILDKVCKLQAKRFTWKDNTQQRRSCEDVLIGLLAQDVQTDFPEVVASVHQPKITGVNPETLNEQLGDNLAIDYGKLVPVLVEALKEAKTRIETLEAEVAALKSN